MRNLNFQIKVCNIYTSVGVPWRAQAHYYLSLEMHLGNTYFIICLLSLDHHVGWNYESIFWYIYLTKKIIRKWEESL